VETLAATAPPPESVSWSFTPLAVFGSALVALAYAANVAFWWISVPRFVLLGTAHGSSTPLPPFVQVLSTWSGFVHQYALPVFLVLAVLAAIHARALFDRSRRRRRVVAWLGLLLVGFALVAQYAFALLSLVLNMGK
jgi:type II secretory pathway component PulF